MSDVSYVIDIAASMPAGEATNAQLDRMIQGLTGAGKGADFFQQAIKQVSASLDIAKAASAAANTSLAEGQQQYRQLEKAANVAAKASEKAAASGRLDPELTRDAHQADAALKAYALTLKSLEQSAASATKGEAALATQLDNVKKLASHTDKSLAAAAEGTEKLRGGLASIPGPVGKIGSALLAPVQGFQKLSAQMGSSNAAMLLTATAAVGVVVAIAAITAAVIAGTIAIAAWAVGLADAGRSAALTRDAAEGLTPELAGLRGMISSLDKDTNLGESALRDLAKQLVDAKVPAQQLGLGLEAAALAEKALGKGGSGQFVAQIKAGKLAVADFASFSQAKFGGVVAKQMRGLDDQSVTFKKHIGEIFGGLDIEPVLRGLERLVGLFDQSTVAGQTIKFLFDSIFQPLINQADKAALVIEAFALGFLIGLTKVYIAVKPALKAVEEFFGFKDTSLTDILAIATKAGEYIAPVFLVFVGVLVALVGAVVACVAPIIAIQAVIYGMVAAVVYAGVSIVQFFIGAWNSVRDYLNGLVPGMGTLATDLISGFTAGIIGGGPAIIAALTGVVGKGIDAAKHLLGIASPSKVFAEIGMNTAAGFTGGVDDGADAAQGALVNMVDPAPAAASAQAPSGAGSSSGGPVVNIENLYLAGSKASDADKLSLSEALTALIRGDASALSGEPAPA